MWIRAKFCLLRCSNGCKIAVMENPLRHWSAKRAWSTQRMRWWWTERHQARTSAIWKNSSKRMSWKAGSRVSQSISLYQLANHRMLEFYYEFLDRYFDRRDFELTQVDMDSSYTTISASWASGHRLFTQSCVQNSIQQSNSGLHGTSGPGVRRGCSNSNVEGSRMIALCLKCYCVDKQDNEKMKFNTTGICRRDINITWYLFKAALNCNINW